MDSRIRSLQTEIPWRPLAMEVSYCPWRWMALGCATSSLYWGYCKGSVKTGLKHNRRSGWEWMEVGRYTQLDWWGSGNRCAGGRGRSVDQLWREHRGYRLGGSGRIWNHRRVSTWQGKKAGKENVRLGISWHCDAWRLILCIYSIKLIVKNMKVSWNVLIRWSQTKAVIKSHYAIYKGNNLESEK